MSTPKFTETEAEDGEAADQPRGLPSRCDLVAAMLDGTKRTAVPIRRAFVQVPPKGLKAGTPRGAMLAKLVKIRQGAYLDAFLLIHAMASASAPYDASYPAISWAHALGLDELTGNGTEDNNIGARAKWSKLVQRLKAEHLITSHREGNRMIYGLLHETGDESAYVRPKAESDGVWFSIPDVYWREDFYMTLSLPAKAMLLIALHEEDGFRLPLDRVPTWYGISRSTAKRGFAELEDRGILSHVSNWRVDPKSPTQWAEERKYTLAEPWVRWRKRKDTSPQFADKSGGNTKKKSQRSRTAGTVNELIADLNKTKVSASKRSGKAPRNSA